MKQWVKVAVTALVVGALAMSGIALAQTSGTDDGDVTDTRAYTAILDALSDHGVLTMTRWWVEDAPAETQRLVALAADAVRASARARVLNPLFLILENFLLSNTARLIKRREQ